MRDFDSVQLNFRMQYKVEVFCDLTEIATESILIESRNKKNIEVINPDIFLLTQFLGYCQNYNSTLIDPFERMKSL
jgi:hypothetical protein